jgi:hypothetical protein
MEKYYSLMADRKVKKCKKEKRVKGKGILTQKILNENRPLSSFFLLLFPLFPP